MNFDRQRHMVYYGYDPNVTHYGYCVKHLYNGRIKELINSNKNIA